MPLTSSVRQSRGKTTTVEVAVLLIANAKGVDALRVEVTLSDAPSGAEQFTTAKRVIVSDPSGKRDGILVTKEPSPAGSQAPPATEQDTKVSETGNE